MVRLYKYVCTGYRLQNYSIIRDNVGLYSIQRAHTHTNTHTYTKHLQDSTHIWVSRSSLNDCQLPSEDRSTPVTAHMQLEEVPSLLF